MQRALFANRRSASSWICITCLRRASAQRLGCSPSSCSWLANERKREASLNKDADIRRGRAGTAMQCVAFDGLRSLYELDRSSESLAVAMRKHRLYYQTLRLCLFTI